MRNSQNEPFIPASSLCGVYRSAFSADEARDIFGDIYKDKSGRTRQIESKIYVYDGALSSAYTVSSRDNVALEAEYKVAKSTGKFDYQIVEPGAVFTAFIEIPDNSALGEYKTGLIERIVSGFNSGELRLGSKTTRGMGRFNVKCVKLDFTDVDSWLEFDMFDGSHWETAVEVAGCAPSEKFSSIVLTLKQIGGVSVREYFTGISQSAVEAAAKKGDRRQSDAEYAPDYIQLTYKGSGQYVIPGTSWAGAFRSRYKKFAGGAQNNVVNLFGDVYRENGVTVTKKSDIVFFESVISAETSKIITRNALDRFSGATKSGALYSEQSCFFGETTLEILVKKDTTADLKALAACIFDLAGGFMAVGGLTSVGRGIFSVEKMTVNGEDRTDIVTGYDTAAFDKAVREGGKKDA